jgi:hypothetical protein
MTIRTDSSRTVAASLAGFTLMFAVLAMPLPLNAEERALAIVNDEAATEAYWTPERLQSAKPMPLPGVSGVPQATAPESPPAGPIRIPAEPPTEPSPPSNNELFIPTSPGGQSQEDLSVVPEMFISGMTFTSSRLVTDTGAKLGAEKLTPYTMEGLLFFVVPSGTTCMSAGNYVCSATVQRPGIIATAGHCTSDGSSHPYQKWMFVPASRSGSAPFGKWNAKAGYTSGVWANGGCSQPNDQDVAVLVLAKNKKGQLVGKFTGTVGFSIPDLYSGQQVTVLGYPGNLDSGTKDHRTDAQANGGGGNTDIIGSDAGPGSSGGGWIVNFGAFAAGEPVSGASDTTQNELVAVTSYGPKGSVGFLGASILDSRYVQCTPLTTCAAQPSGLLNIACVNFPQFC